MRTTIIALLTLVVGLVSGYGYAQISQPETTNIIVESSDTMPAMDHDMDSMEMSMDLGEADSEYDRRFIDAMIVHHEGAIEMARDVQENSTRPELLQLADEIITAQQTEIEQMQTWRDAWYGAETTGSAAG